MARTAKQWLGEILVSQGVITQAQLEEALVEQRRTLRKLGEVLVSLGFASEEQITEARARQLDFGYLNLAGERFDPGDRDLVPEELARTYQLVPVGLRGGKLVVAMVNPGDLEAIDLIQFHTHKMVEPMLASQSRVLQAIERCYGYASDHLQNAMDHAVASVAAGADGIEDDLEDIDEIRRESSRAPVIEMVNMIIAKAAQRRASDIHIEPQRESVNVRYRVDGVLCPVGNVPKAVLGAVVSRIKIISGLDISERRRPQDGRAALRVDGRELDLRISTTPTLYGERIVMRLLDRREGLVPLDKLGFSHRDTESLQTLLTRPHGMILVSGPTGSGKTTTLYALLGMLVSDATNIMTVEDPVEYELPGISQTNVQPKVGITFASQLRSMLRQDPDIILVGEIRDTETADIAFRASLTGHLVLSSLHANDAPSSITRLLDMGVEPYLVSSSLSGVLAQRLVRVLCPACKEPYQPDTRERLMLGIEDDREITLYRPTGCQACDSMGFRGRTAVGELMLIGPEFQALALSGATPSEIGRAAVKAGMTTMFEDARKKVLSGIAHLDEVQRRVFAEIGLSSLVASETGPVVQIPRKAA